MHAYFSERNLHSRYGGNTCKNSARKKRLCNQKPHPSGRKTTQVVPDRPRLFQSSASTVVMLCKNRNCWPVRLVGVRQLVYEVRNSAVHYFTLKMSRHRCTRRYVPKNIPGQQQTMPKLAGQPQREAFVVLCLPQSSYFTATDRRPPHAPRS